MAGIHGNSPSFAINNENILDLRIPVSGMEEHGAAMQTHHARHFSGSSSSVSSNGPVGENLAYEDFNSTYNTPEASDFHSRDLNQPSTTLNSAVASPHQSFQATPPRGVTRSRAGSQPTRPTSSSNQQTPSSARFAPYSMDQRRKHWTTDAVSPTPNRNWSPLVYKRPQRFAPQGAWSSSYQSSPQQLPSSELPYQYGNMPNQQLYRSPQSHISPYPQGIMPHDACGDPQPHIHPQLQNPPPLMSHGLFRMLQSNADPINHQRYRYADLSDPPDLFASLHDKQLAPPEEDMNPSDPDLIPHEQELRFDGDLYTPRWVRGHGNKREGWCGICKPGRWLVLKNSAFWYDKSFSHGVSAATGSQFQEPQDTRRMDGNPDVWEGLCGSCNEWVALVSSKKKGTTWFRHAYKVNFSTLSSYTEQRLIFTISAIHISRSRMHQRENERAAIRDHLRPIRAAAQTPHRLRLQEACLLQPCLIPGCRQRAPCRAPTRICTMTGVLFFLGIFSHPPKESIGRRFG